ncbi:MAG: FAD/NAD(P)-binding protein [Pseudomonadota bacterium]
MTPPPIRADACGERSRTEDLYLPRLARIVETRELTAREKFFRFELDRPLGHRPGQFVMLTLFGIGESAISIACPPRSDNILETVIRRVGNVTGVFHGLEAGAEVGIRGPFGTSFHLADFYGRDLLIIAGGLGLVPLRGLIGMLMAERSRFGRLTLIVGARTPAETLFRDELAAWRQQDARIVELVDRTDHLPWDGSVGLVTGPIGELLLDPVATRVVLCGPPVMYKFVLMELRAHHHVPPEHIWLDLERRMRCGVGKCGHCQINGLYCCQDGPVFRYSEIQRYPEALL